MVRNMVDAGGMNDLKAASAFDRESFFDCFVALNSPELSSSPFVLCSLRAAEALQQELLLRFMRRALAHRACAQRAAAPSTRTPGSLQAHS